MLGFFKVILNIFPTNVIFSKNKKKAHVFTSKEL